MLLAPPGTPSRLLRGLQGTDRVGLLSFPHERRRSTKPVRPRRSLGRTNPPRARITKGTPGPPPRRRTPATSHRQKPRRYEVAPIPCYCTRLSDNAEATHILPKAISHAQAILWPLAQSSLLSSSS